MTKRAKPKVREPMDNKVGWPELGGMDWRDVTFDPVPPSDPARMPALTVHCVVQDTATEGASLPQPATEGDAPRPD